MKWFYSACALGSLVGCNAIFGIDSASPELGTGGSSASGGRRTFPEAGGSPSNGSAGSPTATGARNGGGAVTTSGGRDGGHAPTVGGESPSSGGGTWAAGGPATGGQGTGGQTSGGGPSGGQATGGRTTTDVPGGGPSAGGTPEGGALSDGGVAASTAGASSGTAGAGGGASLRDGLVLLLHMEEPEWTGAALEVRDSSGAENHGTAVAGATTTSDGIAGRGASLANGYAYIDVPDAPSLHPTTAMAVSAWVWADDLRPSYWPGIVSKRYSYREGETVFSTHFGQTNLPDMQFTVDVGEVADNRFDSVTLVFPNRWYHIAVVYDGAQPQDARVQLYIDGTLDRNAPASATSLPQISPSIEIGRLRDGGSVLVGRVDEVAMWTRPLTAEEVLRVYNGELNP